MIHEREKEKEGEWENGRGLLVFISNEHIENVVKCRL